METVQITDEMRTNEWRTMLKAFDALTEKKPPVEKVKEDLLGLKEAAMNSARLTGAQKDGIVARCNNYINGTFGTGAIKEEYMKNNPQK